MGAAAAPECVDGLLEERHAEDPAGNAIRCLLLAFLEALATS
jgi:hypothetical protein